MEHTIHLAAKAFLEALNPFRRKKKKKSAEDDVDEIDEEEDDWAAAWDEEVEAMDDEEVEDVMDFLAGDVLGKVLALVNQVCSMLCPLMKIY
jgi:uncharacterized membrane protein YdbT with pleckstrin-like domain